MSLNFSKKTWADGANGGTPITAAELNRHEDAIAALAGYLPVYDVQNATDAVSHTPCLLHVKGTGQMIYFDGTNRVPANQFDAQLNGDSTNAPQTKAVNSAIQSVRDSLSPSTYIACGRTNEGVSALGAVSFKFPTGRPSWAAGRRPDSFVFSDDEQGNNNEIVQKRYMSRLWSLDANGGQFRILRSDTWSWINGGKYPVSWIATWNK